MAAIVYRGPMAKFFSWTIFTHDFELYPFDRELSYDFGWVVVMLLMMVYNNSQIEEFKA